MENTRFVEYIPTLGENTGKQLGVAYIATRTVDFGEIMLGFKIVEKKDGSGRFIANPTWKHDGPEGEEWKNWTMIDSNIAIEQIHSLIKQGVRDHKESKKVTTNSDEALPF